MKRLLLVCGLFTPAAAPAVGIVPPVIIVEQKAEAKGDQPPAADEDPLKTIERITMNARAVGDRLQNEDSGTDTQKVQEQLLKDIDSLIKPPPPMGGGGGGGGGSPPPPMGGGNPPPMGNGGGGSPPPTGGGGGGQSKRPRGGEQKKEPMGGGQKEEPMGGGQSEKKEPMGGGTPDPSKPPMDMGGGQGGKEGQGGAGDGGKQNKPNLPLDDPFTRRVWGHLPEKLRQQAMQSYREQFMPQYSELLKQYYSNLNEKQTPSK